METVTKTNRQSSQVDRQMGRRETDSQVDGQVGRGD